MRDQLPSDSAAQDSSDRPVWQKQAETRREIVRLASTYTLPQYVREAPLDGTLIPGNLHPRQYADTIGRRFPCHTKAAAWASAVHFLESADKLQPSERERIGRKMRKLATEWGIADDVATVAKAIRRRRQAAFNKTASVEPIPYLYGNRGPLKTANDLNKAAAWLLRERDYIPLFARGPMAAKILKRAEEIGHNLGNFIPKLQLQAGMGFCPVKEAVEFVRGRAARYSEPAIKQRLQKMAEMIEKRPDLTLAPGKAFKIAAAIDIIDRSKGLTGVLRSRIRPEEAFFRITLSRVKSARDGLCKTASGAVYHVDDFKHLTCKEAQEVLGTDFANEVCGAFGIDPKKVAEKLASAPIADAEAVDQLLRSKGVKPKAKKAAARKIGFTAAEYLSLARS